MDFWRLTVVEAVEMFRGRRMSCRDYVEALIERSERFVDLNAFTQFAPDNIRSAARKADEHQANGGPLGPLHGIPVAIKDCIDIAGMATTAATPSLKDHVVNRTASVVTKLENAGALVFGKTNMYELAFGITSNNDHTGPVRNPHDPSRSAGGSSSGSAAAVAAGLVPAALGTDTAGSVRIPASFCGVFGFRPTSDRYKTDGVMPLFPTRDVPGPLARSAEDLLLLDAVLCGQSERPAIDLRSLRLGLPGRYFLSGLESGVAQAFEETLDQLVSWGVTVVEAEMPEVSSWLGEMSEPIRAWELERALEAYLSASGAAVDFRLLVAGIAGQYVREEFDEALRGTDTKDLAARYEHVISVSLPRCRKHYCAHLEQYKLDAFIFPTTPIAATALGEEGRVVVDGKEVSVWKTMRNTVPATFFGAPGVSVPMARSVRGVPAGLEIDGLPGADRKVLAIAAAIEAMQSKEHGMRR